MLQLKNLHTTSTSLASMSHRRRKLCQLSTFTPRHSSPRNNNDDNHDDAGNENSDRNSNSNNGDGNNNKTRTTATTTSGRQVDVREQKWVLLPTLWKLGSCANSRRNK
eukprot:CAMPEP_0206522090 /NCGR_PEP_ID=MMETSP0324_2-20121206/66769_1 /ASSEMBLY_ACC=CAM_ASM_000836 /TAXON_ID=2866 /ORGANISM="Crypthecodinium cohnii, Strain Seligo" /LENGTH=107 /DNA_ID=CAMNT_0054016175 /DNA_START=108 /DNA_END=428 /DNA_ORIENTATION=-